MFKVMLLQFWYNLSDREIDCALFDRMSFRKFTRFSFDYSTRSHSTICRFRNSFVKAKLDIMLFNLVNKYLESVGLILKDGVIIDSSIILSSRKSRKIIDITKKKHATMYYGDLDAKWTVKAVCPYYDYKLYMSTDLHYGFITGGKITDANRSDTKGIIPLIKNLRLNSITVKLWY